MPQVGVCVFATLDEEPSQRIRRWSAFGIGVGAHALTLGLALAVGILVPSEMEPFLSKAPVFIELVTPTMPRQIRLPKERKPAPRLEVPAHRRRQIQIPVMPAPEPTHRPESPEVLVQAPPPVAPPSSRASAAVETKPQPAPVRTGVFSGGSAVATLKLPAREVQTGGFGSPNGLPGEARGGSLGNVGKLGSFDLPLGEGYGNGSGGTRGARGTVASAGFGNGISTQREDAAGRGGTSRGSVRAGGFDIKPVAQAPAAQRPSPPPQSLQPVEILSKPKPAYTEEARKLGLQGEVVLAVVFTASGKLHVLRVVQGLGHGLDESAWRAAEQIRFKPAQQDGQPVDFPATLRVVFQLAG